MHTLPVDPPTSLLSLWMNEWMNEIYFCVKKKHGIHKVQNKEISYHIKIKLTVHYIFPKILHKKRILTPPRQKAAVGYTKYLK